MKLYNFFFKYQLIDNKKDERGQNGQAREHTKKRAWELSLQFIPAKYSISRTLGLRKVLHVIKKLLINQKPD